MTREEFEQFTRAAFVTIYAEIFAACSLSPDIKPEVAHKTCLDVTAIVLADVVENANRIAMHEAEKVYGPSKS